MGTRLGTGLLLAVLTLGGVACGDDDDGTAARPAGVDPRTEAPAGPGRVAPADPAAPPTGDGLGADLELLGYALERAIGESISGYEVDGNMLRITVDEAGAGFAQHCMIVEMTAGSLELPPGSQVQVLYNDGVVDDCEIS